VIGSHRGAGLVRFAAAASRSWRAAPVVLRWMPPIAVMAALWWSSSRTPVPGEAWPLGDVLHNAMHVVAFGLLGTTLWFACHGGVTPSERWAACVALAVAVAYGIVDELHQATVPGRVSSVYDVASDACGAALAVHLLRRWHGEIRPSAWSLPLLVGAAMVSVSLATWG